MKNHVRRFLVLFLIFALLLPLSVMPAARAEETDAGSEERTDYDGETGFTIDFETDSQGSEQGITLSESLPGSGESGSVVLDELDLTMDQSSPIEQQEAMGDVQGETTIFAASPSQMPKQLTIEDIQAMNPGSTVIDIYTNDGYLSTLVGKYYDKKVTNVEEGVASIQGMASLLGLSKGCDFFAVYSETNNTGYTFYTYQQRYGGYTLRYATLRVIVDPQGYTAGLSCSFVPNVGTASKEPTITKEQAEQIVKRKYARFDLTYYTDQTVLLAVPYNTIVVNCYVVYTNNPDADASFDMPYLEHLVTTDGSYLTIIPASSFATSSGDAIDNSHYFDNMKVETYTTTVELQDGTSRKLSVPISYNSRDKKYYLMDPSRKIAVAQYYDFNYRNYSVNFVTSDTIDGWSDNNLLAYANYIVMYDFYADHGIRSVDSFGTPILVTVGWCEKDGTPVDNACYYGVNHGWACFGVSDINHSSDCVDVVGHEYTHGVTNNSMQGCVYRNETGAINEAYSDIMGNLAEMSMNYTSDRSWLHEERSGKVCRNLGDPNTCNQPAYVGDIYYRPAVANPDFSLNDYGGVHINNSLLGHIAYLMDQTGMSYEQQIGMWLTSIELINPRSDYQDLHGALLFSLKINGLLTEYGPALNKAFAEAGLNDDWTVSYLSATKKGYGRVTFETDDTIAAAIAQAYFYDENNNMTMGFPDMNGTVSLLLPAGKYKVQMATLIDNEVTQYRYTASGWSKNGGTLATITVKDGAVTELQGTSNKSSAQAKGLDLVSYDGKYFSMLMPKGWKIEINGEYANWSVKIYDPNDKSTQMFFYGGLAPLHKSETSRRIWAQVNTMIGNGPVLSSPDIIGILNCWNYCGQYQAYYDGKKYFDDLYNIYVTGGSYYSGYYTANWTNVHETACFATCDTEYADNCYLTITSALVDEDVAGAAGGYMYYTLRDLSGIMAPSDRYEYVFDDLLACLKSITFTDDYIRASQRSVGPMASQAVISDNLEFLCRVHTAIYENYGM